MKQNKIWLFVLITLVLSSFAFASVPVADIVAYYKLDETSGTNAFDSTGNGFNGTASNSRIFTSNTGTSGIINSGADFSQGDDWISTSSRPINANDAKTIAYWTKKTSDGSGLNLGVISTRAMTESGFVHRVQLDDDKIRVSYVHTGQSSSGDSTITTNIDYVENQWYHIVTTTGSNGVNVKNYVNGVLVGSGSVGSASSDSHFWIGRQGLDYAIGQMDEVGIWDRALTSTEIEALYNAQKDGFESGQYPTFSSSSNFEITAINSFNQSSINIFNATINEVLYTTTNGTIITPFLTNESFLANITVVAEDFIEREYLNYNTSQSLQAELFQAGAVFTVQRFLTNNLVNNFTIQIEGESQLFNITTETEEAFAQLNAGDYTATVFKNLTQSVQRNFTIQPLEQKKVVLEEFKDIFLYFRNEQTSDPLANADVKIQSANQSYNFTTNTEGMISFASWNGTNETFNITFQDFSGLLTPITFERTYTSYPVNETFDITTTTWDINIFFRSNNAPFNKTAQVIIQGLGNFTTSSGSIFIQNATITQGTYDLFVFSEGFFVERRQVTYTSQDALNVNFYMAQINESNSGTVTVRAVDDFQRLLAGAKINLLEYKPSILSYVLVSQCFTDTNGECKFLVETNTKTYKFTAETRNNGELISAETPAQVFSDSVSGGQIVLFSEQTITITLSFIERYTLNPINNLRYNITESFNEVTNRSQINTVWRTIDGTEITICLEYFLIEGGARTSLTGQTFCTTSSQGQILPPNGFTLNRSKDYLAEVYILTDERKILLESFRYNSIFSFEQLLRNNATLPMVVLFLWIIIISSGIVMRNIPLTGILIIIGAWVIAYIFPSVTIVSFSVLQTLLGIGLIYNGRKKEDIQ